MVEEPEELDDDGIEPVDSEELVGGEEERLDDLEVTDEPERPSDAGASGSLSDAEETAKNVSDIQTIAGYLHPKYPDKKLNSILQSAASSRVYPENVLDKNNIIVLSRALDKDPFESFDLIELISYVQDGISIGIDGKGRVEDLELAGVSNDKELQEISKKMGL